MAACKCFESKKDINKRAWVVMQYKCNYSAFNGYQYTPSEYSEIQCRVCGSKWRTKANFVEQIKDNA